MAYLLSVVSRRTLRAACAAALALVLCGVFVTPPVAAQAYQPKRITFVVPAPPGGGHDLMARIVAERLTAKYGQPVIVDNRPGGGGIIAAEYVSRAAPDGHTFLFGSPGETVIAPLLHKSLPYDPWTDLKPVTLAATTPLVIITSTRTHISTLGELIAKAKANPKTLAYGSFGVGSSTHLAGALLNNLAGIDLLHVPYKGAAPATNAVLGGEVPLAIVGMASTMPHIKAGTLIALAVTQARRAAFAPEIPTAAETPGLEGFEATHWMGVFAPGKTPDELVARLQARFALVIAIPEVKAKLLSLGIEPVGSTPSEFRAFLAKDRARFTRMFVLSGVKPE